MKEIINFIEANVDGKTLFTNELVYKLENGALQGVYSDQISFSNLNKLIIFEPISSTSISS